MSCFTRDNGYSKCQKLLFACTLLLSSCNNIETTQNDPFIDEWRDKAEMSRAESLITQPRTIPRAVPAVPKQEKQRRLSNTKTLPTKVISLKMSDADITTVLRSLAKLADQNVMIATGVEGIVSVDLKDVPWDQAFRGILKANSLFHVWEYDVLRILSMADMEKGIKFEELQTKMYKARQTSKLVEPLQVRAVKIHHLDVNKVAVTLKGLLTKEVDLEGKKTGIRGAIIVDEDINTIIIHASSSDINHMLDLIEEIDRPSYIVFIEAQIVLATKEVARALGTEWNVQYADAFNNGSHNAASGVGGKNLFERDNFGDGFADTAAGTGTIAYAIKKGKWDINMTLQTLETDDKINVISSPSITTLDNHTAYVESGTEIPYQTSSDNNGTETEFKKAVLRLEVTPHVIDNNILKIAIFASKDEPDADQANNDGEPAILTRKTETTLLLRDGQTTVIAGLVEATNRDVESGVPFLMDIPYFGYLFKSRSTSKKFDDLLIFVTPHILNKTAGNRDLAQQSDVEDAFEVIPKPLRIESEQVPSEEQSENTPDTVEAVATPPVGDFNEVGTEIEVNQDEMLNQSQREAPVAESYELITEIDEPQSQILKQSQVEAIIVEINRDSGPEEMDAESFSYAADKPQGIN